MRCCQLIGYIFESMEEIEADYEPMDCDGESLTADVKQFLVTVLAGRVNDRVYLKIQTYQIFFDS